MSLLELLLVPLLGGAGAYFGSYLREKGKNLATREDIDNLVVQLERTTRATEDIKANISGEWRVREKRWDSKFECYSQLAEAFAELAWVLASRPPLLPDEYLAKTSPALNKINRFSTVARIAVAPAVRTLLSTFATRLNAAPNADQKYEVAHRAWLAILDVARSDLFSEPREMTDEEALA